MSESKKFFKLLVFVAISFFSSFSYSFADSAFISGGYWEQLLQQGGLFGNITRNGGLFAGATSNERLVQTNCQYEERPNQFTGQTTYDLICDNHTVRYNSQPTNTYNYNYSQNVYPYQQPVYYTEPVYYYTQSPSSYYPDNNSLSYYSGSNIWYPCDRSGYCEEGLFNTYYRGGRGDVTGFYDDPRLCFDGGPNCSGYYDNDSRDFFYDEYGNYYENSI